METVDVLPNLTLVTADLTIVSTPDALQRALEMDLIHVVRQLITQAHARSKRVAIDVRATSEPSPIGAQEALLQAIRGLTQAYVREKGDQSPPINIVVSNPDQSRDREITWQYLAHRDGGMARGATFDLREERP
jgi:hypothetical protein